MHNTHPIISRSMFGVKSLNNWHRERGYGKTLFLGSNQAWARLKNYNLKSRISKTIFFLRYWKISYCFGQNISFRMKKFQINELIWYKTFLQWSVFDMSHLTSFKQKISFSHRLSKKIPFQHCLTPKKYHLSIVYYWEIRHKSQ